MNYLETLKNVSKDKNKKIEGLVFLAVIAAVLLYSCNMILKKEDKVVQTISQNTSVEMKNNDVKSDIEEKLSNILSQIAGISDVSIALTYSNNGSSTPIYNTKETINQNQTTTEKNVAYNEESGDKVAVIATSSLPTVEGAIVVAKGANTVEMKSKIANAVATCTGIPVHKVQVFEKE